MGLLEVEDAETGKRLLLDTDSATVRRAYRQAAEQRREALRQLTRAAAQSISSRSRLTAAISTR